MIRALQFFGMIVSTICLGCAKDASNDLATNSNRRYTMTPVRTIAGIAGRSAIQLPSGGFCIVMHFPPAAPAIMPTDGGTVLTTDNARDLLQKYPLVKHANKTTFNCVSFALGDLAGLGHDDWIEPVARSDTLETLPARVLLDAYCDIVGSYPAGQLDWDAFLLRGDVQDGDILALVDRSFGREMFAHMGKIRQRDGENWLISKLGVGPVVETTVAYCAAHFNFTDVELHRAKQPVRLR